MKKENIIITSNWLKQTNTRMELTQTHTHTHRPSHLCGGQSRRGLCPWIASRGRSQSSWQSRSRLTLLRANGKFWKLVGSQPTNQAATNGFGFSGLNSKTEPSFELSYSVIL